MSATFHGRYRVEGELTGKPATTAAIDTETERKVAVRTFERTDDAAALDRFRRAADALRSLDHPGIARVLAAGVEDGTPFVVLELDRWKPLEVWVSQRKRLPEGQALAVVAELARAVSFAHAHAKMLAIDLSPENVALVQDEQAGARPVLGTGDLVGTSRSRAPELKGAEPGRTDERALVFDLGALLFFCLTGALPAEAGIALPEGTSPPIATVLGAALRAIPEERPGTVSAFGELCEVARARLRATIRRMPDEVERELAAPGSGPVAVATPGAGPFVPVTPGSGSQETTGSGLFNLQGVFSSSSAVILPAKPPRRGLRILKRALAAILFLAVFAGGVIGTNVLLERARRARALALLLEAEGKSPTEERNAASGALEVVPGLEEAFAFRALARAHAGDLDGAEADVAAARGTRSAERAKAWVLLRRGHDVEALARIEKTPYREDHDRLAYAAGRSDLVANRTGLRFILETGLDLPPSQEALDPNPRLAGEVALRRAIFRGAAGSAFELLSRAIDEAPGTLDAHEALLLRARMEAVELDDDAARRDLARAVEAPPHESQLALAVKERVEKILAGNDGTDPAPNALPSDLVDRALAYFARETARAELERHRLTGKAPELARATKRLRRALAIAPGDESARVLFARALERRSHENAALLAKLATVLGAPDSSTTALLEAARIRLALADAKGAREALATVEKKELGPVARRLALGLGAVLGKDRARAGAFFGREGLSPEDGARAEKAVLAFVLERPMDAANDLAALLGKETSPRAHLDLAASLCANDAPGALAHLVRAGTERASGDALAVLDAVGLSLGQGEKDVQDALAAKGLSPEEARAGTALVRAERSLKPPWNEPTFPELDRTWKAGELDPLLISSAHDLAPLRPDVRFEKLIRALER